MFMGARVAGAVSERFLPEQGDPVLRLEREGPPANFFFFFTLVTGPRRSLSLKLSDAIVYEPQIRAPLGTTAHLCKVVVLPPAT